METVRGLRAVDASAPHRTTAANVQRPVSNARQPVGWAMIPRPDRPEDPNRCHWCQGYVRLHAPARPFCTYRCALQASRYLAGAVDVLARSAIARLDRAARAT